MEKVRWYAKTKMKLTLLLLMFNGTVIQATLPKIFNTLVECDTYADTWRDKYATHSWDNPKGHGYFLNSGKGTFQGHYCE